jgi:hypothetical protein
MFSSFMNYIFVYIIFSNDKHNKTNLNTNYVHAFDLKENGNKYILENSEKMNFIIDANTLIYKPKLSL